MRKTVSYLINRFSFENLKFNKDIIYPTRLDLKVFQNLEKLDKFILKSAGYENIS